MEAKLSLVAQYDDLVRNRAVLTAGVETEFLKFVQNQELCRKRWLEAERSAEDAKERVKALEQENVALQTKLKHARSQIDHELRKRQRTEQERDAVERQIVLVRELLTDKNTTTILDEKDRQKLAFLSTDFQASQYETSPKRLMTIEESGSLLSPSDISYDKTEEDINESYLRSGRPWKRPSAPPLDDDDVTQPGKRSKRIETKQHRRSNSAEVVLTSTAGDGKGTRGGDAGAGTSSQEFQRSRRFSSPAGRNALIAAAAASEDESDRGYLRGSSSSLRGVVRGAGGEQRGSSPTDGMKRYNSGNALNKQHIFVNKTMMKAESCIACAKKFRFGKTAIKCKDCRATAHPECKEAVPLPCVPTAVTPGSSKTGSGYISEYAPLEPPMIPGIVIHCVNEVESRGLGEVGLYRVSGSDKEVKELKEKFLRNRGTPNLNNVQDIHVICSCLKDFLRSLKEPLVTYDLWNYFIKAAEKPDRQDGVSDLYQAISMLPQPNRDTIAFLMLHLQRIAECSECKMPATNLAKVFGPTVVGYSAGELDSAQMMMQTGKQAMVIERLMSISSDYWTTFINVDHNDTEHHNDRQRDFGTPISADVPQSMLGPVAMTYNDGDGPEKSRWFSRTPATCGSTTKGRLAGSSKPTNFFSSPMLK